MREREREGERERERERERPTPQTHTRLNNCFVKLVFVVLLVYYAEIKY
jgi:hypothetical protein